MMQWIEYYSWFGSTKRPRNQTPIAKADAPDWSVNQTISSGLWEVKTQPTWNPIMIETLFPLKDNGKFNYLSMKTESVIVSTVIPRKPLSQRSWQTLLKNQERLQWKRNLMPNLKMYLKTLGNAWINALFAFLRLVNTTLHGSPGTI